MSASRRAIYILVLVCVSSFALLLLGQEHVYDDLIFVLTNPLLHQVRHFGDCFTYAGQATKPVFNFFLAFGHWLFSGALVGQRAMTLFFHIAVAVSFYLLLLGWSPKTSSWKRLPLWAALLFSLHPLQSESIAVVQFRGEILGALFCLLALLWFRSKLSQASSGAYWKWGVFFLLYAAAALSKEVYGVVLPFLVLASASETRRHYYPQLAACAVCVLGAIGALYGLDPQRAARFSYVGNLGFFETSFYDLLLLSGRALAEGLLKWISGAGLTTIRLSSRASAADLLPPLLLTSLPLLWVAAGVVLWWCGGFARRVAGLLFPVSAFYLLVPNANVGSEHYWYFACMGLAVVTAAFLLRFGRVGEWATAAFLVLLLLQLQIRSLDYKDRLTFAKAEWQAHPESAFSWVSMAATLLQREAKPEEVDFYVKGIERIDPHFPQLKAFQFMDAYRRQNCEQMRRIFPEVLSSSVLDETKEKMRQAFKVCG